MQYSASAWPSRERPVWKQWGGLPKRIKVPAAWRLYLSFRRSQWLPNYAKRAFSL